jgi:2-acylglycerol O-acyltransferase 2
MSLVYWTGRWGVPFGFVPRPHKLVIAIGAPIDVTKTEKPMKEEIDTLHSTFVKAVKDLYDRHKHRMGDEWVTTHEKLHLETERPSEGKKND